MKYSLSSLPSNSLKIKYLDQELVVHFENYVQARGQAAGRQSTIQTIEHNKLAVVAMSPTLPSVKTIV